MTIDDITILYEDDNIVVINKPSGIFVHRDAHMEQATVTVADWHVKRVPSAANVGEPLDTPTGVLLRPGIVHRLDRETSGVLVLAKTQEAFTFLKAQFHDREAKKEYRAFVYGELKEKKGVIDRPITRSAKDFRLKSAQRGGKGIARPALTEWECIAGNNTHSYVRMMPKTGRTHQLRVHMKAINHPIVCDKLYAPKQPCELGFGRLALHAYTLTLQMLHKEGEEIEEMTFVAPLPQEFLAAEQKMTEDKG